MKLKPFNYEEAIKDISNVITRSGKAVQEIYLMQTITDASPLLASIEGNIKFLSKEGRFIDDINNSDYDLFIIENPKCIKWRELPEDTLIKIPETSELRYLCRAIGSGAASFKNGVSSHTINEEEIEADIHAKAKLIEQPMFTFWQGGKCPVPVGVQLELTYRSGEICQTNSGQFLEWEHDGTLEDIIAYRILGAAEGYTPFFKGEEF